MTQTQNVPVTPDEAYYAVRYSPRNKYEANKILRLTLDGKMVFQWALRDRSIAEYQRVLGVGLRYIRKAQKYTSKAKLELIDGYTKKVFNESKWTKMLKVLHPEFDFITNKNGVELYYNGQSKKFWFLSLDCEDKVTYLSKLITLAKKDIIREN